MHRRLFSFDAVRGHSWRTPIDVREACAALDVRRVPYRLHRGPWTLGGRRTHLHVSDVPAPILRVLSEYLGTPRNYHQVLIDDALDQQIDEAQVTQDMIASLHSEKATA